MLSTARYAAEEAPEKEEHQGGAWRLGVCLAVTIDGVPKNFPKISSNAAGSQPGCGLSIICNGIMVGAVGIEPTTR